MLQIRLRMDFPSNKAVSVYLWQQCWSSFRETLFFCFVAANVDEFIQEQLLQISDDTNFV